MRSVKNDNNIKSNIINTICSSFFIIKVMNSVIWMIGSILLILMSIFSNAVEYISNKLGFIAPVNFVFLVIIAFLLVQNFIDNIRISTLNEKIKDLDHYVALENYERKNEKQK